MKLLLQQKLPEIAQNTADNNNFYRYRPKFIFESNFPKESQDENTKCDINNFLAIYIIINLAIHII